MRKKRKKKKEAAVGRAKFFEAFRKKNAGTPAVRLRLPIIRDERREQRDYRSAIQRNQLAYRELEIENYHLSEDIKFISRRLN